MAAAGDALMARAVGHAYYRVELNRSEGLCNASGPLGIDPLPFPTRPSNDKKGDLEKGALPIGFASRPIPNKHPRERRCYRGIVRKCKDQSRVRARAVRWGFLYDLVGFPIGYVS